MQTVLLILVAVSVLVFAVCGYWNRKTRHERKAEIRQVQNERAASQATCATIFVVLPAYSNREAEATIQQLYEKAYIPHRVRVGVMTGTGPLDRSCAGEFYHNVSTQVLPVHLNAGASTVRAEIMRRLYSQEKFVLCTHAHMSAVQDWDEILVQSLYQAYRYGGHLISQLPLDVPANLAMPASIPPTFALLYYKQSKRKVPIFKPRLFVTGGHVYETPLVSAKCLFGEAQLMGNLFEFPTPFLKPHEDDYILSLLAYHQQLKTFNPMYTPLLHISNPDRVHSYRAMRSSKLRRFAANLLEHLHGGGKAFQAHRYPTLLAFLDSHPVGQPFAQHIGISAQDGEVRGKSLLGIFNTLRPSEIQHKYGTEREFEKYKQQFCY